VVRFDDKVPRRPARKLKNLDELFGPYASEFLPGEGLDPGPLSLPYSTQPVLTLVEDLDHEMTDPEAGETADGQIEARVSVYLNVDLDLNDEDGESETTGATFDLSPPIDPDEGPSECLAEANTPTPPLGRPSCHGGFPCPTPQ
jgi:hypothetical protein